MVITISIVLVLLPCLFFVSIHTHPHVPSQIKIPLVSKHQFPITTPQNFGDLNATHVRVENLLQIMNNSVPAPNTTTLDVEKQKRAFLNFQTSKTMLEVSRLRKQQENRSFGVLREREQEIITVHHVFRDNARYHVSC